VADVNTNQEGSMGNTEQARNSPETGSGAPNGGSAGVGPHPHPVAGLAEARAELELQVSFYGTAEGITPKVRQRFAALHAAYLTAASCVSAWAWLEAHPECALVHATMPNAHWAVLTGPATLAESLASGPTPLAAVQAAMQAVGA
jgi:hypothetical protein